MDFDVAARMTTLRVGLDSGVTTVDAAKVLAAAPIAAFGDFVHFSDLGAGYMAEVVGCRCPRGRSHGGRVRFANDIEDEPSPMRP